MKGPFSAKSIQDWIDEYANYVLDDQIKDHLNKNFKMLAQKDFEKFLNFKFDPIDEEGLLEALQDAWDSMKTYDSPFGEIALMPNPPGFPSRKLIRIKRKNGKVETHILTSDGSIDMGGLMPFVKLKKGDKVIG